MPKNFRQTNLPGGSQVLTWYVDRKWGYCTQLKDAKGNQTYLKGRDESLYAPDKAQAEDNHKTAVMEAESTDPVYTAIREGRAYVRTAFGQYIVRSYNRDTGWITCNQGSANGSNLDQRSFMVCAGDILITDQPINPTVEWRNVKSTADWK